LGALILRAETAAIVGLDRLRRWWDFFDVCIYCYLLLYSIEIGQ